MTRTRVAVRGVVYESIGECSEVLGVHRTTITRHLNAGTADNIGLVSITTDREKHEAQ